MLLGQSGILGEKKQINKEEISKLKEVIRLGTRSSGQWGINPTWPRLCFASFIYWSFDSSIPVPKLTRQTSSCSEQGEKLRNRWTLPVTHMASVSPSTLCGVALHETKTLQQPNMVFIRRSQCFVPATFNHPLHTIPANAADREDQLERGKTTTQAQVWFVASSEVAEVRGDLADFGCITLNVTQNIWMRLASYFKVWSVNQQQKKKHIHYVHIWSVYFCQSFFKNIFSKHPLTSLTWPRRPILTSAGKNTEEKVKVVSKTSQSYEIKKSKFMRKSTYS